MAFRARRFLHDRGDACSPQAFVLDLVMTDNRSFTDTDDLCKMLDIHVDGVRYYLHLQIGKPLSKDLISAPEIALDNLHREMKAALRSGDDAQAAVGCGDKGEAANRENIAKAIAYELEEGSAHGARVASTTHLDNYHIDGHVNLLALADAVLRAAAPQPTTAAYDVKEPERLRRCISMAMGCISPIHGGDESLAWYRLLDALEGREPRSSLTSTQLCRPKIWPPSNPAYCNLDAEKWCQYVEKCSDCPVLTSTQSGGAAK